MFPRLTINSDKIRHNTRVLSSLCAKYGIKITGITKCFCADPAIARCMLENGITMLGDSRVQNLKRLVNLPAEKWLIRAPMISEAQDVVKYADVSLHSELVCIESVNRESGILGKRHKIILMADLGDLREGYIDCKQLFETARQVSKMKHVVLYGIGTNLTCFSYVQPDVEKMDLLVGLAKVIAPLCEQTPIISGGNSATLQLMMDGLIPKQVQTLRLGESVLFGRERAGYTYLPNTFCDAFTLQAEIIECKEKPSLPWGNIGKNAKGITPQFMDKGLRMKAICAVGKQDTDPDFMIPEDAGIQILGASGDHLMLDITESTKDYRVGDIINFTLTYTSTLRAFTSDYVNKVTI
jgi:predicted amino acid racemase